MDGIKQSSLYDFLTAEDSVWQQKSKPKVPVDSNEIYGYNIQNSNDKAVQYVVRLVKKAYKHRFSNW